VRAQAAAEVGLCTPNHAGVLRNPTQRCNLVRPCVATKKVLFLCRFKYIDLIEWNTVPRRSIAALCRVAAFLEPKCGDAVTWTPQHHHSPPPSRRCSQ